MLSIPTCFFFLTEEINQIRQETEEYDKVSQVTECRFTCFYLNVCTFSGREFVILSCILERMLLMHMIKAQKNCCIHVFWWSDRKKNLNNLVGLNHENWLKIEVVPKFFKFEASWTLWQCPIFFSITGKNYRFPSIGIVDFQMWI